MAYAWLLFLLFGHPLLIAFIAYHWGRANERSWWFKRLMEAVQLRHPRTGFQDAERGMLKLLDDMDVALRPPRWWFWVRRKRGESQPSVTPPRPQ